jgi:hypothetical protein
MQCAAATRAAWREVQHQSRFPLLLFLAGESRRWERITQTSGAFLGTASTLVWSMVEKTVLGSGARPEAFRM